MITKSSILITSLGRTGTKFFAALFRDLFPDGTSLHEPDVFNIVQYQGTMERLKQIGRQLRQPGVLDLYVRRLLGQPSLIEVSDARARGQMKSADAAGYLLSQRQTFVNAQKGSVYVEANIGYYGQMDILGDAFAAYRAVYMIRDGRDWVRSHMNWGQMYGKGQLRRRLAHTWPTAEEFEADPYQLQWPSMSRFERLCWAWTRLNSFALDTVRGNPKARLFRFEDVFLSADRVQHLSDLVCFATALPGVGPANTDALESHLGRQIHKSESHFPAWHDWSPEQKQTFRLFCGPLMDKLDYASS